MDGRPMRTWELDRSGLLNCDLPCMMPGLSLIGFLTGDTEKAALFLRIPLPRESDGLLTTILNLPDPEEEEHSEEGDDDNV